MFVDRICAAVLCELGLNHYVVKVQGGFDDDGQLAVLLNPTLCQLNLAGSTITDRVLLAVVEKCPNLKRLTLTKGNYRFSRKGLKALFGRLHNLEDISAKNCALIDDSLVAKLALNCPNLHLLDLEACANVSNCSAEFLKHRRITHLNLSHTSISDEFFKVLADSPCGTSLIDLNAWGKHVETSRMARNERNRLENNFP
ncbi:conserved hypothetical protein [Culex quinquefasciatus]|uniref:F-box/leucine rich repeat protein n=1 Tax=Culex quinquefasciatus TaxID=7176 RepID=B0X714_CULQU|nr:conserved hypothetical protein [Culex quinquefasciatus]|eukprot:XP_001865436.1 conserved hypothetical protein [Culex quinquefasciatus]